MSDGNATREARQILSSSVGTPSSPEVAQEVNRLSGGNLPVFSHIPPSTGGSFPLWISIPLTIIIIALLIWGQAKWGGWSTRHG